MGEHSFEVPAQSIQRILPRNAFVGDEAVEHAERLAKRRALRAGAPEIRRMRRIACHRRAAAPIGLHDEAAADAAIGARGAHRRSVG